MIITERYLWFGFLIYHLADIMTGQLLWRECRNIDFSAIVVIISVPVINIGVVIVGWMIVGDEGVFIYGIGFLNNRCSGVKKVVFIPCLLVRLLPHRKASSFISFLLSYVRIAINSSLLIFADRIVLKKLISISYICLAKLIAIHHEHCVKLFWSLYSAYRLRFVLFGRFCVLFRITLFLQKYTCWSCVTSWLRSWSCRRSARHGSLVTFEES